ncbi:MAG: glycine--tRNA ligase subunit beta [Rhodoferax sp.]|nr:glycine--tRNA ligase subunit beta [Rhodoferax sp.]
MTGATQEPPVAQPLGPVDSLVIELLVEELPPKALRRLGEAFSSFLVASLRAQGLVSPTAVSTTFATPRRLAVHIDAVADQGASEVQSQKLMPVSVGLDATGHATPALLKKLQSLGAGGNVVTGLRRAGDGKAESLFLDNVVEGTPLADGLQKALNAATSGLPIPKMMRYQLESDCELPGWSSVSFVRPAHGLLALYGAVVVPLQALGLRSGNTTIGHRFEALVSPLVIGHADEYEETLRRDGAVIASFAKRRQQIIDQIALACSRIGDGVQAVSDDALLDEVTGLVERPNVVVCSFEPQYLEVPQECLILTMKANQKYFPLLDAAGRLSNRFLVVSNISPADTGAVVRGNERVIRPRLADAKFFFDQDRKKTLESRIAGLGKVVYHNKLGSQGERMERVRSIARVIGREVGGPSVAESAYRAAMLAKADLLTDMVSEFPELQGVMGGYYARHDGELEEVALAIEDHYKPRFAGDDLPRNKVGLVVALADKLETLVGMFAVGNLPTGDKDPFALRRHALGIIRMLVEAKAPLGLRHSLDVARSEFPGVSVDISDVVEQFIFDRLKFYFRDVDRSTRTDAAAVDHLAYSSQEVDAVLALRPQRLANIEPRLQAVLEFGVLPEAPALAAANKRIGNILKKEQPVDAHVSQLLLQSPAEIALFATMQEVVPKADALFEAGNYTDSLKALAVLRAPVDAFFETVMVNAPELDLRLNRLGLLQSLHAAMNRVADLSRLAA